jgi:signal transduction histidine kinase
MDRPLTPVAGKDPPPPPVRPRSTDGIDVPEPASPRIGRAHPTVGDRQPGVSSNGRPDGLVPARAAVDPASPPAPVSRREQEPGTTAPASAPAAASGRGQQRDSTKRQLPRIQTIRADQEHDHEELAMLADRERIAVDLNDRVIRRIFAAGLALQSTAAGAGDPQLALRIQTAIDELDGVISDIPTTIFGLETRRGSW